MTRLFELREALKVFLTERNVDVLHDFWDSKFELRLAYLVDIFAHLNKLNLQLQGSGIESLKNTANIFAFEDTLHAFICKIE